MQPGRKLDAVIAEKVMEYKRWKTPYGVESDVLIHLDWYRADGQNGIIQNKALFDLLTQIPRFSTDIAAAWEVVEKLREKHWYFKLYCHHGEWAVLLDHQTASDEMKGLTAPHGICMAALRAVEYDPVANP